MKNLCTYFLFSFSVFFLGCDIDNAIQGEISSNNETSSDNIIISNLSVSNVLHDSFDVAVDFSGDENRSALVELFYCNETDDAGCTPSISLGTFLRGANTYTISVSGLSAPDDPTDQLTISVGTIDTDGVAGSPLISSVTLSTIAITVSNLVASNITETGFDVIVDFSGDVNSDGTLELFYCNDSDVGSCVPSTSLGSLARNAATYSLSVTGLSPPDNPGDDLNLRIVATDGDGTSGSPINQTIRLAINDITVSNLVISNLVEDGFDVSIDYSDDNDADGSASLYYCNDTDSSGCTPSTLLGSLTRGSGVFTRSQSGLNAGDDPGDSLSLRVTTSDGDGVTGSPQDTTVVLAVHSISISNFVLSNVTETSFDVSIDFTNDEDSDAGLELFYCNETDNSGCSATTSLGSLIRGAGVFTLSTTGLSAPNHSGDELTLSVTATDTDGVTGSPAASSVTLTPPVPVEIYRSVGTNSAESDGSVAFQTGGSSTSVLTITSGIANFSTDIGDAGLHLGDVIVYDSNNDGTNNAVMFVHANNPSDKLEYTVRLEDGSVPTDMATGDLDWMVYRAYTKLANAESGTVNTQIIIDNPGVTFDSWNNGKDLTASNEVWNIACYSDSVDTSNVVINGWTTSATQYLRIFAPYLPTHTHFTHRHEGVWDNTRYHIVSNIQYNPVIDILDEYVRIEGLQIENTGSLQFTSRGISTQASGEVHIINNIVRFTGNQSAPAVYTGGIFLDGNLANLTAYVINNIVYGFATGILWDYGNQIHGAVYNNTTVNNTNYGIYLTGGAAENNLYVANNISVGSGTQDFFILNTEGGDYNLSSDTTANDDSKVNGILNASVEFMNTSDFDYRLSAADTSGAVADGDDLSADATYAFNTDINLRTRASWDIGASIAINRTNIYRSIGPGNTSSLANGSANNMTISGSTATFQFGLPNNIGVGDAIQYDSAGAGAGAVNNIVFIHERHSDNFYTVKKADGSVPVVTTNDEDWDIFRAYSSLADSIRFGNENMGIAGALRDFDVGGKDITHVTGDDELWHFAIYSDGVGTANFDFNHWTTSKTNYVRYFTPTSASEVGISQRHEGVWSDSKGYFTASTGSVFGVTTGYVRFEGLQIYNSGSVASVQGISLDGGGEVHVSNSIIKATDTSVSDIGSSGIKMDKWLGSGSHVKIYNNIIYGFGSGILRNIGDTIIAGVIYNNTVHSNRKDGIIVYEGDFNNNIILKNNISVNNNLEATGAFDYVVSTPESGSSYNLASDTSATSGGMTNAINSASPSFINSGASDYRLKSDDASGAKGGALDLSSDNLWAFSKDIMGNLRAGTWDMGANNNMAAQPIEIYRSVGYNNTTALEPGTGITFSIVGSTATFDTDLADTIGVGDAIQYDSDGNISIDAIAFIHQRTSSREYIVKSASGGLPTSRASALSNFSIFRAYTSLNNAAGTTVGTENTGIAAAVVNFDTTSSRDIVTNNEKWFFALYADANHAASFTQNEWITSATNNKTFFTPYLSSHVGISQRHDGSWDSSKFHITPGDYAGNIFYFENNTNVIGIQIHMTEENSGRTALINEYTDNVTVKISHNIIKKTAGGGNNIGIYVSALNANIPNVSIYNNIIYGFDEAGSGGIYLGPGYGSKLGNFYVYNNTIYGCKNGIYESNDATNILKNNISYNSTIGSYVDYTGTYDGASANNLSADATSPNVAFQSKTLSFTNTTLGSDDLHLVVGDTDAIDQGLDLSLDTLLNFSDDIDSSNRAPSSWDLGAHEY
ncbi:MAG: hypothetical protein HOO06_09095 [Bdellovibrionaceae bacterium]|nr:hypothetical protein [Pseudobdellovibrionaceae bacterium]